MSNEPGDLYLGTDRQGARALLPSDNLTTHAVCLGMTGSGKTGLGIVALEELARHRVGLLVIDLKGDMVNLLLTFPSLSAEAFAPWLPAAAARADRAAAATAVAARWQRGLASAGLGADDVRAVREGLTWQLLTPGVSAAPLDILPALSPPKDWTPASDPDGTTARVNGLVSALLSLVGRGGDPLTDRDHVLLATIILEHWRRGDQLDLPALLRSIADPPIDTLGALPLDTFSPRKERMELLLALNTLLASPAFAAWTRGVPLHMDALLGTPQQPRGTILSLAHLDERQRLFILGLVFSELVAWIRRQPASSTLRALLYTDEVQGILPPHPANPPTKGPLLTLLKQGRAFGVGAWLATQNPVDLDYKALGNAGVKLIGRLITERDRERALEGLGIDTLADGTDADQLVASLEQRQFLLYNVHADQRTSTFSSRWAMSYLRGPVTLVEMEPFFSAAQLPGREEPTAGAPTAGAPAAGRPAGSRHPPLLASQLPVSFATIGGVAPADRPARPGLLVRCRFAVERKTLGLSREQEELWQVPIDDTGAVDWQAMQLCADEPALTDTPPPGMIFPPAAPSGLDKQLDKAEASFLSSRAQQPLPVLCNRPLKLVAAPDEIHDAFLDRCLQVADHADDSRQDRVRKRYQRRMQTLRKRLERERDELERDQTQLQARRAEEKLGVVEGLFSVLLGSRSLRSAAGKAASRARSAAGKRRVRQRAEASVVESENEIERLEQELQDLADELQDEIDTIAATSDELAEQIETVNVHLKRSEIALLRTELVWRS